jgi:hypothetical protein
LIVEGRDDQWSIIALTGRNGWDWEHPLAHYPYIDDAKGVEPALEALAVSVRTYSRIGIVVDADIEPRNRWAAIRDKLRPLGLELPASPERAGTVVNFNTKRVGAWLMPDNLNPGKLEDFLAMLIPAGNSAWTWADEATKKAKAEHGAAFSDPDFIKARIHAWLAWARDPGQPFGTAITAATFATDSATSRSFLSWLERLYGP